jgi:hypothetical protein
VRKALNDTPIVQVAVLAVLALVVGFLLLTRVASSGSESGSSPATATSSASAAPGVTTTPDASAAAPSATTPSLAPEAATPAAPVNPVTEAAAAGDFVAGPGLPAPVVKAYADNKVVVLLVVRRLGIDDEALRRMVERQGSSENVSSWPTRGTSPATRGSPRA